MKSRTNTLVHRWTTSSKEEGILEETCSLAIKETVAWQVQQAMAKNKIT